MIGLAQTFQLREQEIWVSFFLCDDIKGGLPKHRKGKTLKS